MKWLLFVFAMLLPVLAVAGTLQPLTAAEVPALLRPPAHGERIIALWALDCAYCEPNLEALATLQRAHPQSVELVIVATDSIELHETIGTRLRGMKMDVYPTLAYAEASPAMTVLAPSPV